MHKLIILYTFYLTINFANVQAHPTIGSQDLEGVYYALQEKVSSKYFSVVRINKINQSPLH